MSEPSTSSSPESFELPTNPRESKAFFVPDYMHDPQVYHMYGHQIRIWRTELKELDQKSFRLCSGLMEWTDLKTGLTTGLQWKYSVNHSGKWKNFPFILYGHYPGEQPCKDICEVYSYTTAEIKWTLSRIRDAHDAKTKKPMMSEPPKEGFPRSIPAANKEVEEPW